MILYEWGLLVIREFHLPIHCECVGLSLNIVFFCHSLWKVSVWYVCQMSEYELKGSEWANPQFTTLADFPSNMF